MQARQWPILAPVRFGTAMRRASALVWGRQRHWRGRAAPRRQQDPSAHAQVAAELRRAARLEEATPAGAPRPTFYDKRAARGVFEMRSDIRAAQRTLYAPLAPSAFGDLSAADSDGSWRWNLAAAVAGAAVAAVWTWQIGYSAGQEDTKHALRARLDKYRRAVSPPFSPSHGHPRSAALCDALRLRCLPNLDHSCEQPTESCRGA